MPHFFVLERAPRRSTAYAARINGSEEAPMRCIACRRTVGLPRAKPPFQIHLMKAKQVGDFVDIFKATDMLVSERVSSEFKNAKLKGIERIFPVEVAKVGIKGLNIPTPSLFGVNLIRSYCRVDYDACDATWTTAPSDDYCHVCGPGGGGKGGSWWSIERLCFDISGWDGEEIFIPINLGGTVVLTDDALSKVDFGAFTNCRIIPAQKYRYEY